MAGAIKVVALLIFTWWIITSPYSGWWILLAIFIAGMF
jgi:hypothetical protein